MILQRALFICIFFTISLQGAYEARTYKEFIRDALKQLDSLQQLNEEKIELLESQQASLLQTKRERKSIAFENRIIPVEQDAHAVLQELRTKNRLVEVDKNKLKQELSPQRLERIKTEADEEKALKRAELQLAISELAQQEVHASFAENFFNQQKKQNPGYAADLNSFLKSWEDKRLTLSVQRARQEALLNRLANV